MQADIQLIDINGFGYAAMYQPNLAKLAFNGVPTGGIHGAVASLLSALSQRPGAVPVVLWDGHARWRKELYPDYKGNRKGDPEKDAIREAYERQVPHIQMFLGLLGVPQVRCGSAEADDLAGVVCRELDPSWGVELVTRDTDWWQALREGVVWFSPMTKQRIGLADLADPDNGLPDGHFISPREYICAKALAGDTSDNIVGIEKVGLKTAVKLMREAGGTIEQFWAAADAGAAVKGVVAQRVASEESRQLYARNLRLMDWALAPALDTAQLALTAGEPDWASVEEFAADFGLSRVLSQAKSVLGAREGQSWRPALTAVDRALHYAHCQPLARAA